MASNRSPGHNPPECGRTVRNNAGLYKNCCVKLNYQHMHQGSPLFSIFRTLSSSLCRHSSAAHGHLHASIQPNLGLPHTRGHQSPPSHTVLILSLHVPKPSQYSLIYSTRQLHSIPVLLRTSSFLTLQIRDTPTKLLKHFISRTFIFLLIVSIYW